MGGEIFFNLAFMFFLIKNKDQFSFYLFPNNTAGK